MWNRLGKKRRALPRKQEIGNETKTCRRESIGEGSYNRREKKKISRKHEERIFREEMASIN